VNDVPLFARWLLVVGGSVALALGVLGVLVPLLPTAPFVLLAAWCYARAWPAAHRWLRTNRLFGPICRRSPNGRYLSPRAKSAAIVLTLASFGTTIGFAVDSWPLRIALAVLGLVVVTLILRLPSGRMEA